MEMSKLEKVIREFEHLLNAAKGNYQDFVDLTVDGGEEILALLKEHEPLEPYACEGDMMCGNGCEIVGYIRESDGKIECLSNYCPHCGRPVKWD